MNRRILIWVTVVIIAVAAVLAWRYAGNGGVKQAASQSPVVGAAVKGQTAPQFSAATDQGYFDLAKSRKPVLLEVFATWCPHCQRESAVIDRLYQQYRGRVDFVGVSGDDRAMDGQSASSEQDVLNFAAATHAQYPLAYDASLQVAHEYLQGGFPTLVVIAKNKKVAYITSGETPYSELNAALSRVLTH